jgi:YceI-like domain
MERNWEWRSCHWILIVFAGLLSGTVPHASGQGAPATTGQAVAPTTKTFEPGEIYLPGSRVYVFVGKTGLGHEHAVMGQLTQSNLRLDVPENSGQLVFDLRTFTADSPPARQAIGLSGTTDASTQEQVTANMLSAAVLDVAHFPTASFTVRRIVPLPQPSARGFPQYQLVGDFSLHGVTKPIQVVAEAEEKSGWIRLRGGFVMQQTQFGIQPFSKAFGALGVTDQLNVYGDLWLSKERQVANLPTTHK